MRRVVGSTKASILRRPICGRTPLNGEIMSIIKEGIRFTGMPGWGGEGDEKLVLFVRHLPELSEKEIEAMQKVAGVAHAHSH